MPAFRRLLQKTERTRYSSKALKYMQSLALHHRRLTNSLIFVSVPRSSAKGAGCSWEEQRSIHRGFLTGVHASTCHNAVQPLYVVFLFSVILCHCRKITMKSSTVGNQSWRGVRWASRGGDCSLPRRNDSVLLLSYCWYCLVAVSREF